MAEKQDMPMNAFSPAADVSFIYAEAADGSQIKIEKSNLILLLKSIFSYIDIFSFYGDLDTIDKTGIYMIFAGATNGPGGTLQGSVLFNMFWNIDTVKQMYFAYGEDTVYIRSKRGIYWSNWKEL